MKKISIILFGIAVISAFGFASTNSNQVSNSSISQFELTVLKGAEKSGVTQSNQNW